MLSRYDHWVIGFYFLFMLVLGWVCRRFISNTSDYFRSGGKILWWMAGSSAFSLSFSAWTFTGGAGKAYEDGPIILVIYAGNAIGFLANYLYFAPRFRQMRVVTAMEGVRHRFGPASEQFFTWLQIPLGTLYAGIWLTGLSVFISAVLDVNMEYTIIGTGTVVLMVVLIGGSWAVVAGDFMQMLILMPITIVAASLSLLHVGGLANFFEQVPRHHFVLTEGVQAGILDMWIVAILIKQFVATNSMLEASRYLTVKDTRNARKAALLGMVLSILGPLVWFIPPMVSAITHPNLHELYPRLKTPAEAAYVAACFDVMPAGMIGMLISGIFAASMSTMDGGLNRNAGFFVKNFYQVVLRPNASEKELLLAAKLTTLVLGILVIIAAMLFSRRLDTNLFNLMQYFGGLVALPCSMPLVLGLLIKKAPSWAGWTTVLAGLMASLLGNRFLDANWVQQLMGWPPLNRREQDDWGLLLGVLLNVTVCSVWFVASCYFSRRRPIAERTRVEEFFKRIETPVVSREEGGAGSDAQQYRTLGWLCVIYGSAIALLLLVPNPMRGRIGILFCSGCMVALGGAFLQHSKRLLSRK